MPLRQWIICAPLALPLSAAAAADPVLPAPTYAQPVVMALPIDLPTALRLVDEQSPTVGLAQARVQEALGRVDQASVLFLPTLAVGSGYFRHDGVEQNRRGEVFNTSRGNVTAQGLASLRVEVADALFAPLVARRLADAAVAQAQAVRNQTQLEAASAYLDLLQVTAAQAINADTLTRAQQMLARSQAADQAGLSKTAGDVNRAQTEVSLRLQEQRNLVGQHGAASARLARVLFLQTTTDLTPADPAVVPWVLVPGTCALDELVQMAFVQRPELAATRAVVGAGAQRVRQARLDPLIPKVQVDYRGGGFAGERNGRYEPMCSQGELQAGAYWELRNLGLGNAANVRTRQAEVDQAHFRALEVQAQVQAEVVEAAKLAAARYATLADAQTAVQQATELYRKLLATSFGMVGPRPQYDALEPLLAIQALNQARVTYLAEVIEFNRAQFRLYTALGQPANTALPTAAAQTVAVPVVPAP
jgi:outer membrane protein TolC